MTQLKHSCSCLEGDVRRVTSDKHVLETRVRGMVEREQLDDLITRHKVCVYTEATVIIGNLHVGEATFVSLCHMVVD